MKARTTALIGALLGVLCVSAVAVALVVGGSPDRVRSLLGTDVELIPSSQAVAANELTGITGWHNTPPVTIAGLRGRVVVVDFWTYTCINCRRTFPFLRALHRTYADRGLTVLGVHTPEFDFEKLSSNVERAVRELDVTWAVAEDPDRATWDAYQNQYWPAKYLVDRAGRMRLLHIGEGGDAEVEEAVRTLLAEGGDPGDARVGDVEDGERPPDRGERITPEVYLGAARGERFVQDGTVSRGAGLEESQDWLTATERGATLMLRFSARDVYSLLAPMPGGAAVVVELRLDGAPIPAARRGRDVVVQPDGRTVVRVTSDDLRHVVTGPKIAAGRLELIATSPGVRFVTFTFGA